MEIVSKNIIILVAKNTKQFSKARAFAKIKVKVQVLKNQTVTHLNCSLSRSLENQPSLGGKAQFHRGHRQLLSLSHRFEVNLRGNTPVMLCNLDNFNFVLIKLNFS